MPTSKQRREAARRHLERQLQRRQEREAARRRITLIASIVGTVVLIAAIVLVIALAGGGSKNKKSAASTPLPSSATSAATSPTSTPTPAKPATGKSVTFAGLTVKGATDLTGYPTVTVTSATAKGATKLEYKDLVVGTGAAATPTSTVTVQYLGVLYKDGKKFDSSWDRGQPAQFPLTQVVKGFTYGIGGTTGVPPMKVGGRRVMILPPSLGYGDQANQSIPAGSTLVFVVDLKSIDASS